MGTNRRRSSSVFLRGLLGSIIVHGAVLAVLPRSEAAPPVTRLIPVELEIASGEPIALGLPDGTATRTTLRAPSRPAPGPAPQAAAHPAAPAPEPVTTTASTSIVPVAPVASTTAAPESEEERTRKLREAVERAMLPGRDGAPASSAGEVARGAPGGVEGGSEKGRVTGIGYLVGWLSSQISARQLQIPPEEKQKAAVLASITLDHGVIQSASVAQPGSNETYNRSVAAALASLAGRTVPLPPDGEAPSGTFSVRLRPR